MNIDRVVFVEMCDMINYTGEIIEDEFYNDGVILKISAKSEMKIWLPIERINSIYFPDKSKLVKDEIRFQNLFTHMNKMLENKRSLNDGE